MSFQPQLQKKPAAKIPASAKSTGFADRFDTQNNSDKVRSENDQQSDLKTQLSKATRFGHNLSQILAPTAIQTKVETIQQQEEAEPGQMKSQSDQTSIQTIIQCAKAAKTSRGKRKSSRTSPYTRSTPIRKHSPGQHGYKKHEQKRLTNQQGTRVSGNTHESEHPVGFEPLNQTTGLKRGTSGRAQRLENEAPAYQEVKELHTAHIGTGTKNQADASGFNSDSYRKTQRSLIESGDISSAVQVNQLGYAFNPNNKNTANTPKGKAANDSFKTMANNMNSFTYGQGNNDVRVNVNERQRQEMLLGREAAQTGKWPAFKANRYAIADQSHLLLAGQKRRQQEYERNLGH